MTINDPKSKLSYGEQLAVDAYARKLMRERNATAKTLDDERSKALSAKKKKAPRLAEPFDYSEVELMKHINWSLNMPVADECARRLAITNKEQFILLQMPTGTGKTATAIASIAKLQETEGKLPVIIIAPRAVVDSKSWEKTVATWNDHCPDNKVEPLMIDSLDRFASILKHPDSRAAIIKTLAPNGIVILDEVHGYKTPTSKRAKTLSRYMKYYRKLGLTATPFTNNAVLDGISYLVISGRYTSKTNFFNVSGLRDRVGFRGELLIYNDDETRVDVAKWPFYTYMQQQLSDIVYSPELDTSTLDMPSVKQSLIQVPYDRQLMERLASVNAANAKGAFDSMTDMLMAVVTTLGRSYERLQVMLKLIKQPGVRQPLIFYWNNAVRSSLEKTLQDNNIDYQVLAGDTSMSHIDLDSLDPLLIQYQAGSEGIEFKKSNLTVFYQNQSSSSRLQQAKGRNVRRGMQELVKQYTLISPVRFDQELYTRLQAREELSQAMLYEIAKETLEELG